MDEYIDCNDKVEEPYCSQAPLPLALERILECRIYAHLEFKRPVLDLGCGEGLFSKILFRQPVDTGIDPNERELARAKEQGSYRELIACYGNTIPKEDGHYQTIFSNSVLEHIEDIRPVLREAHRLLASGGRMYMTVPSDQFEHYTWMHVVLGLLGLKGIQCRYRRFFNSFWKHYHCHSPEEWKAMVQEEGFAVVECHTYGSRKSCLLNDFLLPFTFPAFLVKRLTNRWILFPGLRRILIAPVVRLGMRIVRGAERCDKGGLVFLSLQRK